MMNRYNNILSGHLLHCFHGHKDKWKTRFLFMHQSAHLNTSCWSLVVLSCTTSFCHCNPYYNWFENVCLSCLFDSSHGKKESTKKPLFRCSRMNGDIIKETGNPFGYARPHFCIIYHASSWLCNTLLWFPLSHRVAERLVYFLLRVRGGVDRFPFSSTEMLF